MQAVRSASEQPPRIAHFFPRSNFVRSFLVVLSGSVLARAVLILAMPLLARLYSPEMIGTWQLLVGFLAVLTSVVCARYDVAIMLPEKEEEAAHLFWLCLLMSFAVSTLLSVPALFFSESMGTLLGDRELSSYLWMVPLVTISIGIQTASTYWLNRHSAFSTVARSSVVRSVGTVIPPLIVLLTGTGDVFHLVMGTAIGHLLVTITLLISVVQHRESSSVLTVWDLAAIKRAAARYCNYPLYVAPTAFIVLGSGKIVQILLSSYFSPGEVGLYAMATQLTFLPVTFISQSLSSVFYPKIRNEFGDRSLQSFVVRVLVVSATSVSVPASLFAYHATDIFSTCLGDSWCRAGSYATWMTLPSVALLMTSWLVRIMDVAGQQRLELKLECIYSVLSVTIVASLLSAGFSPVATVAGYCLTTCIYNAFWLCVAFRVAGFSEYTLIRPLMILGILSSVTLGVCHLSSLLMNESYAQPLSVIAALLIQFLAVEFWLKKGLN